METHNEHEDFLHSATLQRTRVNASEGGWESSLEQMDLIEKFFLPCGQVPWNELINALWSEVLAHVKKASLALNSGFMHPD